MESMISLGAATMEIDWRKSYLKAHSALFKPEMLN